MAGIVRLASSCVMVNGDQEKVMPWRSCRELSDILNAGWLGCWFLQLEWLLAPNMQQVFDSVIN
jgi:hypothetical protein